MKIKIKYSALKFQYLKRQMKNLSLKFDKDANKKLEVLINNCFDKNKQYIYKSKTGLTRTKKT